MPRARNMPRVALVSLGCPKNLVDSEVMLGDLAAGGCLVAAPMDQADVVIVNTCGFLAAARDESSSVIAEAIARKRSGQVRRIIVAGCLCNRDGKDLLRRMPQVDAFVGVNDRAKMLSAVLGERRTAAIASPRGGLCSDASRFRLTPRHTAYLRIAEGCSQRCTFCTIPQIRGPLRSKRPAMVLKEVREMVADGTLELNLIAQDTTSYGRDLPTKPTLAGLLRRLDRLDGLEWIRLLYTYPRRFTDDLIDAMASSDKVLPYVDMPLQHIVDAILRRMGRGVSRKTIEVLLDKLRRRIPGITIRTTFIVGFPGETDRQFDELLSFVKDQRFGAVGVFAYSAEQGTPAAGMPDQIPPKVKAQRAAAIMAAQQKIAFAAGRQSVGETIPVLVDRIDAKGRCVGRSPAQAPDIDGVCCLRPARPAGQIVDCRITAAKGYDLLVAPVD